MKRQTPFSKRKQKYLHENRFQRVTWLFTLPPLQMGGSTPAGGPGAPSFLQEARRSKRQYHCRAWVVETGNRKPGLFHRLPIQEPRSHVSLAKPHTELDHVEALTHQTESKGFACPAGGQDLKLLGALAEAQTPSSHPRPSFPLSPVTHLRPHRTSPDRL